MPILHQIATACEKQERYETLLAVSNCVYLLTTLENLHLKDTEDAAETVRNNQRAKVQQKDLHTIRPNIVKKARQIFDPQLLESLRKDNN